MRRTTNDNIGLALEDASFASRYVSGAISRSNHPPTREAAKLVERDCRTVDNGLVRCDAEGVRVVPQGDIGLGYPYAEPMSAIGAAVLGCAYRGLIC
jgi:hypothetical protein